MPARNLIKIYVENGYYHVYNRGVEKRIIFEDEQDYKVFIKYLKEYLSAPPDRKDLIKTFSLRGGSFKGVPEPIKNYQSTVDLVAYCLMPNHFHLLLKQSKKNAMEKFIRSLATRYSMYFNKRYERVGKLFQSHYKASMIENDNYLLYLSKYIHLNPKEYGKDLINSYSSYADYLGIRKTSWIKSKIILDNFGKAKYPFLKNHNTYKEFVEGVDPDEASLLKDLILE